MARAALHWADRAHDELNTHRELVVPPCRLFYRMEGALLWIVHVIRSERILRESDLMD